MGNIDGKIIRQDLRNNLTGKKFGHITALCPTQELSNDGCVIWKCECDCGKMLMIPSRYLTSRGMLSCGDAIHKTTHGETKSRLYRIWSGMKSRCYNKNFKPYPRYGGRGIIVCDEWKNSYEAFRDWALDNGYSDGLTIDRIDNDGNYEPSNYRWSTRKSQSNNTSTCYRIIYNGETKTLKELCDMLSLNYKTVKSRIHYGKTISEALGVEVVIPNEAAE